MNVQSPLSDAQILERSQDHPWMFGVLVDRYQKAFLRKGRSLLHSHDDVEDAVQETFIRIYKYGHKFTQQKNASFRSWAYKILINTCYSHISREITRSSREMAMDFADLDIVGSTEILSEKEQASFVQSVLSHLPHNLSRLLSLYFFEEKSYEEIAAIEGISLSAVRSGLHRAKKQFKNLAI